LAGKGFLKLGWKNNSDMRVVLLGTPGAGKGTQARRLGAEFRVPQLGTGDLLRDAVRRGTSLGEEAREYMESGDLVPDEIMLGLIREKLSATKYSDGFILDGFPRTVEQAEGLDRVLDEMDSKLDCVLFFELDEGEAVERLRNRMTCPNCGATYNTKTNPPATDLVCDLCGGKLENRQDDSDEFITKRIKDFEEMTLPLKNYYQGQSILRTVDAGQAIAQVFQTAKAYLRDVGDDSSCNVG
jgi:adenylate kinase